MNLQLLEDSNLKTIDDDCTLPYEYDEEDSLDSDDETHLIPSALLDTQEEQQPTDDHKRSRKSTKAAKTRKTDSQIGWSADKRVKESAARFFTRTGRASLLPLKLRSEVYGRQEEADDLVDSGDDYRDMEDD